MTNIEIAAVSYVVAGLISFFIMWLADYIIPASKQKVICTVDFEKKRFRYLWGDPKRAFMVAIIIAPFSLLVAISALNDLRKYLKFGYI